MEKTFFVVKPDFAKDKFINFILGEIQKKGLYISSRKTINLNASHIRIMWPHLMRDPVSFFLQKAYVGDKEMSVYFVEGKNAIKIIDDLKTTIRLKYAKWQYCNCIHAPKNYYEYINDVQVMFSELTSTDTILEFFEKVPFRKYNDLDIRDFEKCASVLWKAINKNKYSILYDAMLYMSQIKKYKCLLLKNDDSNKLNYVVAALYEYFPNMTIEWAYYVTMAADWIGEFPILLSPNNDEIKSLISYLDKLNITTKMLE